MRIVLDANVVASAFMSAGGAPARTLDAAVDGRCNLIVSDPVLAEYETALSYPQVAFRHGMSPAEIRDAVRNIRQLGLFVIPPAIPGAVPGDPKDDRYIELAMAGRADFIVTGDKHLLALGDYQGILIVRPAAFVAFMATLSGSA